MTVHRALRGPLFQEVSVKLQRKSWDVVLIPDDISNQLNTWFIGPYESLNMFRALLCQSSGARDYTDGLSVWLLTLVMAGCWSGAWL